jgi:hypothetical protein
MIVEFPKLYNMTFSDLIETVKCLSVEEKEELQLLLKQYLREERREEMSQNFELSQTEEQQGKLKYSANIDELKRSIED